MAPCLCRMLQGEAPGEEEPFRYLAPWPSPAFLQTLQATRSRCWAASSSTRSGQKARRAQGSQSQETGLGWFVLQGNCENSQDLKQLRDPWSHLHSKACCQVSPQALGGSDTRELSEAILLLQEHPTPRLTLLINPLWLAVALLPMRPHSATM